MTKTILKGYTKDNIQVITADITSWDKEAIENLKAEIQKGPIGRKFGELTFC
ncbi:hypothetical protein LCGC14_1073000 [marine sediment metagenome]|uniref:Uncharacterized protein n=1 Tax=marine sediment metagenome TaxID=412755 RepID=A0A0F9MHK1_9ZZZZ